MNKETFIVVRVTTEEREYIRAVSAESRSSISDVVRAGFGLPTKTTRKAEREAARSTEQAQA